MKSKELLEQLEFNGLDPEQRSNLIWWEILSEEGQKLYEILVEDAGDINCLPIYAAECGFNLDVAMDELRKHDFLDESNPDIVRIKSHK